VVKHLQSASIKPPKELPFMFDSWEEYAIHLADNLIEEDHIREKLDKAIENHKRFFITPEAVDGFYRVIVSTILVQDWDFTKLDNFRTGPKFAAVRQLVNKTLSEADFHRLRKNNEYLNGVRYEQYID
jgi:hypothetical protein